MNRKLINHLVKTIETKIKKNNNILDEVPLFYEKGYSAKTIMKESFHQLREFNLQKRIAFIDGGNAELILTPSFSISFMRVYYTIYEKNKRTKSEKSEVFVLIESDKQNKIKSSLMFLKDGFMKDNYEINFNNNFSFDKSEEKQSNVSIINSTRKILEIKTAVYLVETILSEGDIVLMDGTLKAVNKEEEEQFDILFEKAENKNILISALSKTTHIITNKSNSLSSGLISTEKTLNLSYDMWYYFPIVEINNSMHKSEIYFVKLHQRSKFSFRYEIYKNQKSLIDIEKVLGFLALNSKDPVFFGYPYGMIDADKFARVSNNEKRYYKTIIKASLSKNSDDGFLDSLNAHSILDNQG